MTEATKAGPKELPSVLSIKRSLNLTDAQMRSSTHEATGDDLFIAFKRAQQVDCFEHGQRITAAFSSDKSAGNSEKGEESRNLAYGEMSMLPGDSDTLLVQFSGSFLPTATRTEQCDSQQWSEALSVSVPVLLNKAGRYVASCYAYHLCSGIFLWRNREDAESVTVAIQYGDGKQVYVSEALELPMHAVQHGGLDGAANYISFGPSIKGFEAFAEDVRRAISGEIVNSVGVPQGLHFTVVAKCKMKRRQLVHPSQRYMPVKQKVGKMEIGRVFYKIGANPGMTYAKIGNALRRFDRSHEHEKFASDILPTEPNGGSLTRGINLRGPKNGFYGYMLSVLALGAESVEAVTKKVAALTEDEAGYILGVLVRGGVFVQEGNKAKKKGKEIEKLESSTTDTDITDSDLTGE